MARCGGAAASSTRVRAKLASALQQHATPEAKFYRITTVIAFLLGCELTRQGLVGLFWR